MTAMIFPFRELQQLREDNRSIAEENAWNEFLALTREMVDAQNRMHEAHKRYLAIKYPKGVPT